VYRFLDRIWRLTERELSDEEPSPELLKSLHKTIKKVTKDTANLDFNTAISQMMIMVNELYKVETLPRAIWEPFILLLSPYVPHLAEQLWSMASHEPSVANQAWPAYREELTIDDEIELVIQVNGKVRAKVQIAKGTEKDVLLSLAREHERIREWIEGKEIVKEIVVPDKLVNIVVKN
jgi:leucyl-tRNA synthetase